MARDGNGPGDDRAAADASRGSDGPQYTSIDPRTRVAIERAASLDAAWFKRHPDRAHCARPLLEGENPEAGQFCGAHGHLKAYFADKQIEPGLRRKSIFIGTRDPCACEECATDLWRQEAPVRFKAFALEAAAIALGVRP
jgi:hypothetical protein